VADMCEPLGSARLGFDMTDRVVLGGMCDVAFAASRIAIRFCFRIDGAMEIPSAYEQQHAHQNKIGHNSALILSRDME